MIVVEKRRHMRVDDRLVISWRPIDASDIEIDDTRDVMRASVNREIHRLINELSATSPDVVKVLTQLNHKLDLIADQGNESFYGPSLVPINISQSGIAFEWQDAIPSDQPIRLTLNLPLDNIRLNIVANVLECTTRAEGSKHVVRCVFHADQARASDILVRYIDYTQRMQEEENRLVAPDADDSGPTITDYR